MKQFKKRTIALVLASVVTVAGAFGADNYKNSLMALNFESGTDGVVNMVVQTKTAYDGNVTPVKKDSNTYILMLPEINSQAPTPDLQKVAGIESVNIRTMPYSQSSKGYTKITIKTNAPANLFARNQVYIASAKENNDLLESKEDNILNEEKTPALAEEHDEPSTVTPPSRRVERTNPSQNMSRPVVKQTSQVPEPSRPEADEVQSAEKEVVPQVEEKPVPASQTPVSGDESYEAFLLVLGIFFILICSVFFYVKAKNKLREIAGEKLEIDVDDFEKKPKKEKNIKKIKNTIKTLDSKYKAAGTVNDYTVPSAPIQTVQPTEELNIIDLDELFQEKVKSQTVEISDSEVDENDALEDFLSGFSFDDSEEETKPEEDEQAEFDEELYEKTISNDNLEFSNDDVECINKIVGPEINDSTMRNISEYAESVPVENKPTKEQILEDFVAEYTVSQNITFTSEDVKALYKLISVEIDSDFVTDLRTNSERTKQMQEEIEEQKDKPRKPSEILTLNVKDMLPDLSEALRQQGGRRIESEVKPTVVYYSEGYEVSKLSLNDALPDLSVALNSREAYKSKPSAEIQYADTSYEVRKLNISNMLPDLKDVMANPDKYAEPEPVKPVADADALLKNISNVSFKPFDDGTRQFEIINDIPSVSDIQKEFSQFENFEVAEEEFIEDTNPSSDGYDDFESLYSNSFVDLDKKAAPQAEEPAPQPEIEPEIKLEVEPEPDIPPKPFEELPPIPVSFDPEPIQPIEPAPAPVAPAPARARTKSSEDLLRKIEQSKAERSERRIRAEVKLESNLPVKQESKVESGFKCILDGVSYTIISSSQITENLGCHLAKSEDGYTILGYIGNNLFKIKHYEAVKSEKIHMRLSEKTQNGAMRYIVRIGIHKFIVNVCDNNIEYVMDLC